MTWASNELGYTSYRNYLINTTQPISFPDTLFPLSHLQETALAKIDKITLYSIFIDDNGLLKVGGRLHKATLSFCSKQLVTWHRKRKITKRIEEAYRDCENQRR